MREGKGEWAVCVCVLCAMVFFGGRDEIPSLRVLLCCAGLVLCGHGRVAGSSFFFFRVSVLALAGRVGGRPSSRSTSSLSLLRLRAGCLFRVSVTCRWLFPALGGECCTFAWVMRVCCFMS